MKRNVRSQLHSRWTLFCSALVALSGCWAGNPVGSHKRLSDNPDNGLSPEDIEAGMPLLSYLTDKPLAALDDAPAHLQKLLTEECAQRFMKYVAGGALDLSGELTASIGNDSPAMTIQWHGELGLCPEWAFNAPSQACLQRITGYLLASTNAQGLSVPISLRGPGIAPIGEVPIQSTFREDRGTRIASFERCMDPGAAAQEGAARNCGWAPRYVGLCPANQEVTVRIHTDLTTLGAIHGVSNVLVRVADGIYGADDPQGANPTAGGERPYAGIHDTVQAGPHGRITFVCPENGPTIQGERYGYFGIMLAALDPTLPVPAGITVAPVTDNVTYPAHEYEVFTRREGIVWGDLSGGFDEQHACYDEDWNEGIAQAAGRLCLLAGSSCFPNAPRPCGSLTAESVEGFAVYVNDPGDG